MAISHKENLYPHATVKDSLEKGLSFQDFVCIQLAKRHIILQNIGSKKFQFQVGENLQGFEIKLDTNCTRTGRLSIEVAEKTNRDMLYWTDSGIMKEDNSIMYIQGNYEAFWMFWKNQLQRWYKKNKPEVTTFNGTIRRFYLSLKLADEGKLAGFKWTLEAPHDQPLHPDHPALSKPPLPPPGPAYV